MIILGINAFHADASACIVKDGNLIAAAEEERFSRIKHCAGFPKLAIEYCLDSYGCKLTDVDYIALNRSPYANLLEKARYAIAHPPRINAVMDRLANAERIRNVKSCLRSTFGIKYEELKASIHNIEHHRAHLASSFFVSPFESATVVSVDGFGDFVSTMWGEGEGRSIKLKGKVHFPHSLGLFYLAITQFLGFYDYGDEYKVMGLAPYGKPVYLDKMRKIVKINDRGTFELNLSYFIHHSQGVSMIWDDGTPHIGIVYSSQLRELLGPPRNRNDRLIQYHFDIAASLQKMYEDAFFNILNVAFQNSHNPVLCLAGGCAMNSVANGKIFDRSHFKELYIQSAAGDGGGAIGAAFYLWHQKLHNDRTFTMEHAYIGPEFSHSYISTFLNANRSELYSQSCRVTEISDEHMLCDQIAAHIADGKVVGWFQGRMEWGPRALGNRSIICDPRRMDMKNILNSKIKRREAFRPFAPSIIRESMADWFETDYDAPFMLHVYQVKPEKRELIPAVVHVDGTGRPQTIKKSQNPLYYRLIKAFEARTGIPMLLNTSFNENEPIVCRPEEALNCFLKTNMDIVVIGNWIIERKKVGKQVKAYKIL